MASIVSGDDGGALEVGGASVVAASAAPAAPPSLEHLAVPVTRQVLVSVASECRPLLSGIDSLYLGVYVDWGLRWAELDRQLGRGKKSAEKTQGISWKYCGVEGCLILPRGKAPMYAYHLQTADFHLWIARCEAKPDYPNVYVQLLSKALWLRGIGPAIGLVKAFVEKLGGKNCFLQISRADLSTDFLIPGGLSLDFLNEFVVSESKSFQHHCRGERLETFYVGSKSSPIQARIYDKALEVQQAGDKLWFADHWKMIAIADVWRVEFQLRREVLRELGVECFDDLHVRANGIWRYLTDEWLSLRVKDNPNVSRRSVHPVWAILQAAATNFGPALEVERKYRKGGTAAAEWYVSHGAGCLAGFAVREGIDDFESALGLFAAKMREYWQTRSFADRFEVERIKLGFDDTAGGT